MTAPKTNAVPAHKPVFIRENGRTAGIAMTPTASNAQRCCVTGTPGCQLLIASSTAWRSAEPVRDRHESTTAMTSGRKNTVWALCTAMARDALR